MILINRRSLSIVKIFFLKGDLFMKSQVKEMAQYLLSTKISINHLTISNRGIIIDTNQFAMYEEDYVEKIVEEMVEAIRERFDVDADYELTCGEAIIIPLV